MDETPEDEAEETTEEPEREIRVGDSGSAKEGYDAGK